MSEEDFFSRTHEIPDVDSLPPIKIQAEELPPFPFSAMVGQEMMVKAVLLGLANPSVRIVVLAGDRETGKSTCFLSACKLLPRDVPVIEMPLNVTRFLLFGTKDKKGLIDQARGGYLFVERINLFDDDTVGKIASLTAENNFTLLATANLEDGPIPDELASPADMLVTVKSIMDIEERIEILKRLEEYRGDMKGFYGMYSSAEEKLCNRLTKARNIVKSMDLPKETTKKIETLCKKHKKKDKIDSLGMAAASNAALDGRTWADSRDVDETASLVLGL